MKKYLAECIGTFVLVALACGVAAIVGCADAAGKTATSLAFGLVIVGMAYSIGNISGCHINPAVSFAMLLSKKMSLKDFVGYVIAQVFGAFLGALVVALFAGGFDEIAGCVNGVGALEASYGDVGALFVGLAVEAVLTFVFVLAILGVTSKSENTTVTGLVIGGALTLVHLLGTSLTGTSVNPARSIGPAIVRAFGGNVVGLQQLWVFIVGPLVGAALAALVWKVLTCKKSK
ncbi:MAG: aquaporin [Clostridia bacterium]|nr:aquaporin [Clostridia bacterium]